MAKELKFTNLSQPLEMGIPIWPWVGQMQDVIIERMLYHERDSKQSAVFHCKQHTSTHMDCGFHVLPTGQTIDQIPLANCFGTGVVLDLRGIVGKWDIIGPEELEKAEEKSGLQVQEGDWVLMNTGWHHYWDDHYTYINYFPGLYKEGAEWLLEKKIKAFGITGGVLDSPLAHWPLDKTMPWLDREYKMETGNDPAEIWPIYEPAHKILLGAGIPGVENVGGDIDDVTGKRIVIAAFPLNWIKGDGSMVRVVGIEGLDV